MELLVRSRTVEPRVATMPGDIEARYRQLGSLDAVAAAYEVDPTTARRWLRAPRS